MRSKKSLIKEFLYLLKEFIYMFVHVDSVRFRPLALPLLVSLGDGLLGLAGLLGSLS